MAKSGTKTGSKRATGTSERSGKAAKHPKVATSATPAHDQRTDAAPPVDTLMIGAVSEEGDRALVLRQQGDSLSVGELSQLQEGKPITGEVVSLTARPDHPGLFDVKSEYKPAGLPANSSGSEDQAAARTRATGSRLRGAGPARVSTKRYRNGWESLWGNRRRNRDIN